MDRVRRILQVGPVWLTALMTLAAGIPHFHCRCPDGTLKLFCLRSPSKAAPCCCGGSCCSASSPTGSSCCRAPVTPRAAAPVKRSGCCGQGQPAVHVQGHHCQVTCTGCQKSLALVEPAILVTTTWIAGDDLTAGLVALPPELRHSLRLPPSANGRLIWQCYRLPPPTDLVIALQHFLI